MSYHIVLTPTSLREDKTNTTLTLSKLDINTCDFIIKATSACNYYVLDQELAKDPENDLLYISEKHKFKNYYFYVSTKTGNLKEAINMVNDYIGCLYGDEVDSFQRIENLHCNSFMEKDSIELESEGRNLGKEKVLYSWEITSTQSTSYL